MSRDNRLAPDQRAVLELVLRQDRSYGELSELLGIPEGDVRARAEAGLRALAGDPDADVDSALITDFLLDQQTPEESERTSLHLAESPKAQAWMAAASMRIADLGTEPRPAGHAEPETAERADAGDDVETAAALPAPDRSAPRPPRSSKLGGAILLGLVVVIVAVAAAAFLLGGDDDPDASPQAEATATPTATEEEAAAGANDIVLADANGSDARGIMRLFAQDDGSVQFAIAAENVPANRGREVYAVWFTREGSPPRRLGFAQSAVGQDGVLTTGGPQRGDEKRFPRWFATYDRVLVTRETDASAKRPGPAVLQGALPAGG